MALILFRLITASERLILTYLVLSFPNCPMARIMYIGGLVNMFISSPMVSRYHLRVAALWERLWSWLLTVPTSAVVISLRLFTLQRATLHLIRATMLCGRI